jgi:hypothetical protein
MESKDIKQIRDIGDLSAELVFEAYRRAGVEILVRKEKEFVSPGDLYESPYLVLVK